MDFSTFDQRCYQTVDSRTGYGEWADTYEDSVPNELDIRVLEKLESVDWREAKNCLDLACGTGRIGHWLTAKGVKEIDGIDLTPEMLAKAKERKLYRKLHLGSVEKTKLKSGSYDLVIMSLVDEHLPTLEPVYKEATRVSTPESKFVVVGMHPHFFMTGMPTHFKGKNGKPKAIETHIHLVSDHFRAATASGWELVDMHEGLVDEDWLRVKPKWCRLRNHPVNYGYVWSRKLV